MAFTFRKLAAALLAVGAVTFAAGRADAGIYLTVTDGSTTQTAFLANPGGTVTFTGFAGYDLVTVIEDTNYPGGAVGALRTQVVADTVASGPVASLTVNSYVTNSANPYDLAVFTAPTGSLFLNNIQTNSNSPGTTGTTYFNSFSIGTGPGSTVASTNTSLANNAQFPAFGATPYVGTTGYTLQNSLTIDGLTAGNIATVTGNSLVSNQVIVPEPGTMAAALTGLALVGGLGLRRRAK